MARKKTDQETLENDMQFEEAMKRLEEVVQRLEEGDIPLEESIHLYQEGVTLSRICGQKLEAIEAKITQLVEEDGQLKQKAFRVEGEA
ncbi:MULTISPECIES: exodeoxyribonuclease VII small subunit [Brevibacillus]|uniref:Exodeoxyribonuclease 7 small subunit n=1 Tax=Brevibacillus invocatus TaxID=173959 RepID=A0A3M8CIL7_9BACL|nr:MULTISPECIES: exodeoxyribonuclease VII small subunit [Brevibacillus]MCM3078021.1 exodeoxyribonuclease VII small subunit [Brevibacillus invocatus]MCM3427905.1 exodeoxyribonuclease VII small subunit [Brevibacillus invocatus]MDH4615890.1 exodeoxyribonuclease VII small subunit [Brevibacillus sp. AY1]RNB75469.1 exodeoxyribonuclease VII small subunit [Brevibacillus invocatus]